MYKKVFVFQDPVREIRKINEFLQYNRDDELIRDIADACSFANLKKADVDKDHTMKFHTTDLMFRKGGFLIYVCLNVVMASSKS